MNRASIKNIAIYLLPVLLVIGGCVKSMQDPDTEFSNKGYPIGTFVGQFTRIHKSHATYKYDTLRANLKLVLSTNTGYAITGDTATVHAGSYGSFSEDFVNMIFDDLTYPTGTLSNKTHLSGFYTYEYYGDTLKIKPGGAQSDTLKFLYTLKKIN
jgi:endonuclease IV